MHDLQPMQRSLSKSTMPSARLKSAWVGQISTHGASSQWLQRITPNERRVSGNDAAVDVLHPGAELTRRGTSFSVLQATVQAWQPMHVRWSIAKP